ncbi:sodium-extruding oxaloacetate decarboxylase subunit alpha [Solemya elarraichensis gill symbiont]|uniref:Oxaloacetate decarboxylase subunit alpha n=1 Tax=Solemya elarraichensis gill symbiont TaxID=1918949 RepID=A0A1T2LD04_9GAMM|nr:sodium-extruding oxaloacetate decarboxylase subunit alpha [Solemya elarraichensis gill symbiont]OOZ42973.1 oxaloacetate decarboxylase subunit alpha [Solemya elarraichensis gill symbiont]
MTQKKLGITDNVLRDAHQSLFATRLRIEDMLPIAEKLDQVGFWSLETWGGATFDACIRFLGEDPWERLRLLKEAMPNTPMQMLLRGQNILGYRHYADDVVERFVERSAENGMDVYRIFDAMNDVRNLETAVKATLKVGKHAQGTISYTTSPVHSIDGYVDMARQIEDLGCHSICIKDMAGLLKPYVAVELVTKLKDALDIPIALHSHATTGMSTATHVKAAEAGVDVVDTSISSMAMTYGHSATESVVAIMQDTERDTGLDLGLLEEISAYFREIRKKYAKFEGSLRGIDSRILTAQVPGGMLTNMEGQLKEQGAADKFDDVLKEIPEVRKDLGYIPLVTPTSQIVGTQAVLNVLTGERYKSISKETAGILKGEYGVSPAPVNAELQARVLEGGELITCRPADLIEAEFDKLTDELQEIADEKGIDLADSIEDDVLIYAQFPQIGLKFLENRNNPDAFEPVPTLEDAAAATAQATASAKSAVEPEALSVSVNGVTYDVVVGPGGAVTSVQTATAPAAAPVPAAGGVSEDIPSPLAGNIYKINVTTGDLVNDGDVIMILEAMKMETEVRAPRDGTVTAVTVKEGDSVQVGETLLVLS